MYEKQTRGDEMIDYYEEYLNYEDSIADRRASNRNKKKNHKMNGRGLREVGNILVKRAKELD